MVIHGLPKQMMEDQRIITAVNAGHTVYIFNHGTLGEYTLLIADGNPIVNGGDALNAAPKDAETLYLIIPGTSQGAFTTGNMHRYLYTVADYRAEITPATESLAL